jgi:hypothetical protein
MRALIEFIDNKFKWSLRTFGTGIRTKGITAHIRKELAEIEADPKDLEEWVDVILLAFDGASRAGFTGKEISEALISKQLKNMARRWPSPGIPEHEPIEHVR